ncbi:MAG: hypothetical protein GXP53_03405 [Deltaproteobacteria bacterium]|nr:hypothetical protein [Deltaproteobacteria bacterium]
MTKKSVCKYTFRLLIITALTCLFFSGSITAEEAKTGIVKAGPKQEQQLYKNDNDTKLYPVPPPLVYQSLYPCQACHRKDIRGVNSQLEKGNAFLGTYIHLPDPKPRILIRMHRDIRLHHAKWMWCLNCHSTYERNYLKLITGERISFEQSYRLCGQCHGSIYRDWKLGIHGRRVGEWKSDGKKLYLLCTHCHDPHQPHFRKLPGMAIPELPSYGRWENLEEHE